MDTLHTLTREYQGYIFHVIVRYPISHIQWAFTELNGVFYETLDNAPTPLEFSQMVNIQRPVLIRSG